MWNLLTEDNFEKFLDILTKEGLVDYESYHKTKGVIAENVLECTLPSFLAFYVNEKTKAIKSDDYTVFSERIQISDFMQRAKNDKDNTYYLYEYDRSGPPGKSKIPIVRYAKVPKQLKDLK